MATVNVTTVATSTGEYWWLTSEIKVPLSADVLFVETAGLLYVVTTLPVIMQTSANVP